MSKGTEQVSTQDEAIRALDLLPDHDKLKVLEYIQELARYSQQDE